MGWNGLVWVRKHQTFFSTQRLIEWAGSTLQIQMPQLFIAHQADDGCLVEIWSHLQTSWWFCPSPNTDAKCYIESFPPEYWALCPKCLRALHKTRWSVASHDVYWRKSATTWWQSKIVEHQQTRSLDLPHRASAISSSLAPARTSTSGMQHIYQLGSSLCRAF